MEVHSRIEHGSNNANMSYTQRNTTHRPNHSQSSHPQGDIYKPPRSPSRYPQYPQNAQNSPQLQNINQVFNRAYQQTGGGGALPTPHIITGMPCIQRDYRPTNNRISLLHNNEYGGGRQREQQHVQSVIEDNMGGHQIKKMRLSDKESAQPLRIETREQPGSYNPQVEAISPTLPEIIQQQQLQDEQAFRTTKDELIQQIGKVDREIAKAESSIAMLKKKQQELEEVANKPSSTSEKEVDTQPEDQTLREKIYSVNRKAASISHVDHLGPRYTWPIYNQPSDAPVYHENKRRHQVFKSRLIEYFKKRNQERHSRNTTLAETYSKLMQEWLRKVEKIEASTKRKTKEAKNREFFEKVFPELRKQREDKERINRVGARVKSEADLEEIMDNLQEQAMEDKKMRSYAVIPPILLDQKDRRCHFVNNNGHVEDMESVYKVRKFLNVWSGSEKETFKEKYLQHPKNFHLVASYIDRKSVADCVQYYYLSKKTENYKQLLRKSRQRTRSSKNTQKVNNSANTSVVDTLTTGVTTRLQREQQQKTGVQPRAAASTTTTNSTASNISSTHSNSTNSNNNNNDAAADAVRSTTPSTSTTATTTTTNSSNTTTTTSTSSSVSTTSGSSGTTASTPTTVSSTVSRVGVSSNNQSVSTGTTTSVTVTSSSISKSTLVISCVGSSVGQTQPSVIATSVNSAVTVKVENSQEDVKDVKIFKDFNSYEDFKNKNFLTDDSKDKVFEIKKELDVTTDGISDQSMGGVVVEKKKKDKRKDKENTAMETSDEDAGLPSDKQVSCAVCNNQLGPQLQSRPLVASQASQYGLREDQVPQNARVCNTCRCKSLHMRIRYMHCPVPTCPNARTRVKRLRSLPYRLQDLSQDVRDSILAEFRIPSDVSKCCSACFNRIQRRLGPVEEWTEGEITELKNALTELGANWQLIAERMNKIPHQVRSFYACNRKRLNLESSLGDRKPTLTDEEESGSSTSSCEEPLRDRDQHSSDTASAAESPPVMVGNNPNASIKKEDYDSSATETADEAIPPDSFQGTATITPINADGQPRQNTSPLSVKDLVLNVIEKQLMNATSGQQSAQNPPTSGVAPTISSILSSNDLNEVTIVSEYSLNAAQAQNQLQNSSRAQRNDLSLAKLVTPLIGATITPVSGPIVQNPNPEPIVSGRDDLVVLHVSDNGRQEPETLDLSIKKPRDPSLQIHPSKPHPQQLHVTNRQQQEQYIYHQERKSPFTIRSQQNKLPSPKPANPKSGSITLGTPIIPNNPRYEGLLRQMPDTKMGSITQGTPVHTPHNSLHEKRVYEYYSKRPPSQGGHPPAPNQQQQQQYGTGGQQYRQPAAYTVDQHLSSKQIIMNDYITSQQMLNRRNEKIPYYPNSPHRTPPPPPQQQQGGPPGQQRQGVIQRHTRPQYLQPGHEALSSLVDVAVQQPSLPVPTAPHEGLGKTIADQLEQPNRFQIMQQQQQLRQQQRIEEHAAQRRAEYHHRQQQEHNSRQQQQHNMRQQQTQQQQQGRNENNTLTAASLIDAIITHQINQTVEGSNEPMQNRAQPRPSDMLFQNFQRHEPPGLQQQHPGLQHGDNNADNRPPSVISVDIDSEGVNKNLTVKELTDSVISHDFSTRASSNYYNLQQENVNDQWKRRYASQQQQQKEDSAKRANTPQQHMSSINDERQIIRIAQPQQQKYHVEAPTENNHWNESSFRRYQTPQSHISALDYVKNRIVEVMRTEDDKKESNDQQNSADKDRDSPGDMVIDEDKNDGEFQQQQTSGMQQQSVYNYAYVHKDVEVSRNPEPKPLLSAQYEPLSDED